jgi:4-hydroxybenzoate polyprenyltransferase
MLKSIIKLARLRIVATCYALVFVGSAAAGSITSKTLLAFFLIAAVTIHANSINDYADRGIDRINLKDAPDRPLVAEDISERQFWAIHAISGLVALAASFFYGTDAVILTLALLTVDYIYSLKPFQISFRPITSPLLLAAAYVYYSFSVGYWSSNATSGYPWLLTFGLYLGFIARLLLKDFRDVKGDKRHGKVTFLLLYGAKATCVASGMLWFAAMLVVAQATSLAPGVVIPLVFAIIAVSVMLTSLSKSPTISEQQNIVAFIAKAANFAVITILAFLLCQNQAALSAAEVQLIPAFIGTALLTLNWFNYSGSRPTRKRAA